MLLTTWHSFVVGNCGKANEPNKKWKHPHIMPSKYPKENKKDNVQRHKAHNVGSIRKRHSEVSV